MDIEQRVVNPAFTLLAADAFDTGLDESMAVAVTQAMVDEQYHTLMHLNASAVTRRRRGWWMPDAALPVGLKARRHDVRMIVANQRWQREFGTLAFTTVTEISINAYLDLIGGGDTIRPINQVTANLHSRDEYCHSSMAAEITKAVYARRGQEQGRVFLDALADGLESFAAHDYTTWRRIVRLVGVDGGREMLRDVEHDPARKRLLQDFAALYRLCAEREALDELAFGWSTVSVS